MPVTMKQSPKAEIPYRAPDSLGMANEVVYSDSAKVCCDGGKGAQGHPLIYLDMMATGEVLCPYCSRHFIWREEH